MTEWAKDIRDRLEKSTPGPWYVKYGHDPMGSRNDVSIITLNEDGEENPILDQENLPTFNTCEFIAYAPTDIANLLEEREILREALEDFKLGAYSDSDLRSLLQTLRSRAERSLSWSPKELK